jgi:TetR/AcrR family transcriptional regulator, cholesterol catabolism regulator
MAGRGSKGDGAGETPPAAPAPPPASPAPPPAVLTTGFDGHPIALHRRLTARQRATRQQIVDAAIEIATTEGYDALTTRAAGARAGVAIGTVYRYFTSKDHMLVTAMLDWSERFIASVAADPPTADTAAARVVEVFTRFAERSGRRPALMDALFRAGTSSDPTVVALRASQRSVTSRLVELAVGDVAVADRDDVVHVFEDVVSAALGSPTVDDRGGALVEHVARAARLLLRGTP